MKINAAIRECLEECQKSEDPLRYVSVFALTLRADPGWEEVEVEYFERTARRALAGSLDD